MRRPRALLVALSLLLAGCNGIVGDPGAPTPENTVTPVPVPDTEPSVSSGGVGPNGTGLPPGVSENGSVDVATLLAAHNDVLSDRSYRVNVTRGRVDTMDEERRVWNSSARLVLESETRYRITRIRENGTFRSTEYVDGTTTYERVVRNGSVSTDVTDRASSFDWRLDQSFFYLDRQVIGPDEANVTAVERGGRTFYRIYLPSYPGEDDIREYGLTLYVRPDGLVRTIAFEHRRAFAEGERYVRERYAFSDVGAAELDEPEWVSRLKSNRTTETDSPDVAAPSG